jgi:2Fe-2S ferredoxin
MPRRSKVARILRRGGQAAIRAVSRRSTEEIVAEEAFVTFGGGEAVAVEPGTTILAAAIEQDLDLDHFCGGNCSCGTCRVEIAKGHASLSKPRADEEMVLGAVALAAGDRLACQARLQGAVEVVIPRFFGVREGS